MPQKPQLEQQSPARQTCWKFGAPQEPSVVTVSATDTAGLAEGDAGTDGAALGGGATDGADEGATDGADDGPEPEHTPYGDCTREGAEEA